MKLSNLILSLSIIILTVAVSPVQSATIHVPADEPTIQAGINATVAGDTVLVADGTYIGDGNRDIDFGGKGVVLKSENGPEVTIIDCQGTEANPHRGFYFHSGEDSSAVVDGFTIQGGYGLPDDPSGSSVGGGIKCDSASSPLIIHNIISGNSAGGFGGGGIVCWNSNPTISNNTISENAAFFGGGGIVCWNSNPTISNNNISGNSARVGGGIYCFFSSNATISNNAITENAASFGGGAISCGNSDPTISNNNISGNSATSRGGGFHFFNNSNPFIINCTISRNTTSGSGSGVSLDGSSASFENCIIAFNEGLDAISCIRGSNPVLNCSDVYGNIGGDWVGCIAGQEGINGNFSLDPLFCDTVLDNYHLSNFSPCMPQYSPCGELVGALGEGCLHICADANGDSLVNFDDVDFLLNFYFYGGATPFPYIASDLNCDGSVNIADITYLAAYINGTGAAPCCAQ